jgi:methionyl-tRNA formyltransferase
VKDLAGRYGIPVLQPENLRDELFLEQLKAFHASLFIVVAFRMLPREVWAMPPLGTFNLHASLLPQYRGAAPINRSIMNGEKRGGVTTFFIREQVDTGNIIFREEAVIGDHETAGEYHDRLKEQGASLLLRTVEAIRDEKVVARRQEEFIAQGEVLKTAPKIRKEDCRIDWDRPAREIFNLIRGLSPYPGAHAEFLLMNGDKMYMKIFRAEVVPCDPDIPPGTVITDHKTYFHVRCSDACLSLTEMQQAGKKRLSVNQFLSGLKPGNGGMFL